MSKVPRILIVVDDILPWRDQFDHGDVVFVRTPLEAIWHLEFHAFTSVVCGARIGTLPGRCVLELVRERWSKPARILMIDRYGSSAFAVEEALASGAAQAVLTESCDPVALDMILALAGSAPAARQIRQVARSREPN